MPNVYGIDLDKEVTALMVRDVIVACFYEAHCAETGLSPDKKSPANKEYCRTIIEKSFEDSGGDFDRPNKEAILGVLDNLVEFSKNFRDPSIIAKHYEQIMILVDKLEK